VFLWYWKFETGAYRGPVLSPGRVSVGNLDEKGYVVKFGGGKCVITESDNTHRLLKGFTALFVSVATKGRIKRRLQINTIQMDIAFPHYIKSTRVDNKLTIVWTLQVTFSIFQFVFYF
jgi:hypothetical protein